MEYNATVTLPITARDERITDPILDDLRGYSPAIGWEDDGRMAVTITLDRDSLGIAAEDAVAVVQTAAQRVPLTVEVMTTAEFDTRTQEPAVHA